MADQCCGEGFEGAGEAGPKEAVDDCGLAGNLREILFRGDRAEAGFPLVEEALAVGFTGGGEGAPRVEEVCRDRVAFARVETGHGQGVTPVVARTGEEDQRVTVADVCSQVVGHLQGCPLHQVDVGNRLMLYGIAVNGRNLVCREKLHHTAKLMRFFDLLTSGFGSIVRDKY